MKEIQAISKLYHKNIVGYKGCWVEAGDPETDRLKQITAKINRLTNKVSYNCEEVVENDEDDPDFERNKELEDDRDRNAFEEKFNFYSSDE